MIDSDLAALSWRVEEACFNAWPSDQTLLAAGWLIRRSGVQTRRTNSVNPTRLASFDPAPILAEARRFYAEVGKPLIFRAPSIAAGLDQALTREGFGEAEAETITLHAASLAAQTPSSVDLTCSPSREWLQARAEMNAADAASSEAYERTLSLVCDPVQFASVCIDGKAAAIAYGVLSRGLLVIESVATRPEMRRRGLGGAVVAALMNWASYAGAAQACLQVMADNVAAINLYKGFGFTTELYRYHYRRG